MSVTKFFSDIVGGTVGETAAKIGDTIRKFVTTDQDRMDAQVEIEKIMENLKLKMQDTTQTIVNAQKDVVVAELNQDDKFTKRARPTIVYAGLGMIVWNYCISPFLVKSGMPPIMLPDEFWWTWGGVCGVYAIGRSAEKQGVANKLTSFITGSSSPAKGG